MFKKTKRKIILSIMFIMIFLLAGTLCIIYFTSYMDVYQNNQEMLARYTDAYLQNGNPEENNKTFGLPSEGGLHPPFQEDSAFQLSTFYSVKITDNQAVSIDNSSILYSDSQLSDLAFSVLGQNRKHGTYEHMLYRVTSDNDGTLVVFMDNTIMSQSVTTLFKYSILFGSVSLIIIFFFSLVLAGRIVKPLVENHDRQRQFVSDAGHELKTPVSAINANLDILSREIGPNQWISNIQFENERMSSVIRQLLNLARTENTAPPMETVNFSRIVTSELLSFEIIAFENNRKLIYDAVQEELFLHGNAEQLRQLVSILLDNAVEHSPENGKITVSLSESRGKIFFSVTNEGEEIPEEQRELIFERFYRTDFSRSGEEQHYGLGLAIAKAVVSVHKGKISVSSAHGQITFTASFPFRPKHGRDKI